MKRNLLLQLAALAAALLLSASCTRHIPMASGHRGANAIAPENTLASADSCIKYGVEYMETDICISKDSVFYLLHDRTLDRTTNGSGNISEWYSHDIDTLDAGSWFGPEFSGLRVPRFSELLSHANGRLGITVDYRSGDLAKLLEMIEQEGMIDNICFTFSREETAKEFRRIAPHVRTLQAYVHTIEDVARVKQELDADIAVIRIDILNRKFMRECRKHNMQVLALVLGMDDKTAENKKAVKLGVDVIATDRPEKFVTDYPRRGRK